MWGPTVTLGSYKLYFADPQAGQVGFFGTIEEHGHPGILGLRLKIEIRRSANDPSERRPRAELIRVANSYFEGMEAGTDKNTPFDKDCKHRERCDHFERSHQFAAPAINIAMR